MEININPNFGANYVTSDDITTSSGAINDSAPSSVLSRLGNRGSGCYHNGTRDYEEFYSMAQFITGLIIYPILCIIGIIGNALSLIVLSHRDMATSTNVYLMALGVSDTLKLLNDFLYSIMLMISLTNQKAAETMMVNVYPYAHYVFQFAVCVTAWLTVSVAMDRYVSVCHPSRAKSLCTIVRARSMVMTIFLVMAIISIPSAFRYRLHSIQDPVHNKTCMELVVTEFGRNKEFMIPYTWAQNFFRGIIPVFILIFLNARIINVLRKERVKGKKFNSRNRITLMLIAMILVFIICISPDAIMSTFFGKGYVEEGLMVKGIREITDSLLALNSAVNFILYCSLSNLFRQTFCKVFLGKRYVQMRAGSCRQVSNYEPTTLGNNGGCDDNDASKRKGNNGNRKSRLPKRGMTGSEGQGKTVRQNSSTDSPDSLRGLIEDNNSGTKNSGGSGGGRERNNSLCYTDHNDHLYAEMSGVWLGPAPKALAPNSTDKSKAKSEAGGGDGGSSVEGVTNLKTSVDVNNIDDDLKDVTEEDDGRFGGRVGGEGEEEEMYNGLLDSSPRINRSGEGTGGKEEEDEDEDEEDRYNSETEDLLNDIDMKSRDMLDSNGAKVVVNGNGVYKCLQPMSRSNGDIHKPEVYPENNGVSADRMNHSDTWNFIGSKSPSNSEREPKRSVSTDAIHLGSLEVTQDGVAK